MAQVSCRGIKGEQKWHQRRVEMRAEFKWSFFMRNHVEKQCVFTVFIYILAFSCEMLLNFTPKISLYHPYDRIWKTYQIYTEAFLCRSLHVQHGNHRADWKSVLKRFTAWHSTLNTDAVNERVRQPLPKAYLPFIVPLRADHKRSYNSFSLPFSYSSSHFTLTQANRTLPKISLLFYISFVGQVQHF